MITKKIAQGAIIAAIYIILTVILAPISYGPIQVRVAEALTLLPFWFGISAAVALWLGVMVANIFGGLGAIDIFGGSLITLVAGILTAKSPNIYVGTLPPVILNAFGVAGILYFVLNLPHYWPLVLYVGIGQTIAVILIGIPLMKFLVKRLDKFLKI